MSKKLYEAPQVVTLGTVEELTRQNEEIKAVFCELRGRVGIIGSFGRRVSGLRAMLRAFGGTLWSSSSREFPGHEQLVAPSIRRTRIHLEMQ